MSGIARTIRLASMAAALLAAAGPRLAAQAVPLPDLKAAFVANFAKFTEWPAGPADRSFTFCVTGDAAVATALKDLVEKHNFAVVNLSPLASDDALRNCQVLYLGGVDEKRMAQMLAAVGGAPVFTVGDAEHFAERGGVAQLILEKDRMRFAINTDAVQRAHLQLSAKLLTLAVIVKDGGNASR